MIQLMTKEIFSEKVEIFAVNNNTDFMDALIEVCNKYGIEFENVNKLVTPQLKNKIQVELEEKRLIKVNYNKLPI